MTIKTKALVIREQSIGESDRLITLFTVDLGIVKAFVKKAEQIKNKLNSVTSLFAYCDFVLYKGKTAYTVSSAEPIEMFFNLRNDIQKLALAQYLAELSGELLLQEQPNVELLSLVLNSFYLLCSGKKENMHIKAVFEMRALLISGYMPPPVACDTCGMYETDPMFFDISEGKIYCSKCKPLGTYRISLQTVKAIRFICFSESTKIFNFKLEHDDMLTLANIAEHYMLNILGHTLGTLKFYKGIAYE